MSEKNLYIFKRVRVILAVFSAVFTTAESILYFGSVANPVYRFFEIVENVLGAFIFKTSISLGNAFDYYLSNHNVLIGIITYAYGVCIFIAPFCTISWIYDFLSRLFHFAKNIKWVPWKEYDDVLIIAYNDFVKNIIKGAEKYANKQKKWRGGNNNWKEFRFHIITLEELSLEDKYKLSRIGGEIEQLDICKLKDDESKRILERAGIRRAKYIIAAADSSVRNLSAMQMLYAYFSDVGNERNNSLRVLCRCEDVGVEQLIADDFDSRFYKADGDLDEDDEIKIREKKKARAPFVPELFSASQLQIEKMFIKKSVFSCYTDGDSAPENTDDPNKWNVRMLITGFGNLGTQTLRRAVEMSVATGFNTISIDVVDLNVEENAGAFLSRLSYDSVKIEEHDKQKLEKPTDPVITVEVHDNIADGMLFINFYSIDIIKADYMSFLNERKKENGPFTYAVIAIDDAYKSLFCIQQIERAFEYDRTIPIMVQMDDDKQLAEYFMEKENADDEKTSLFPNVCLIPKIEDVVGIEDLFGGAIGAITESFEKQYNSIKLSLDGEKPREVRRRKNYIKENVFYELISNHAAALYYQGVFSKIYEIYNRKNGKDIIYEQIGRIFDKCDDGKTYIIKPPQKKRIIDEWIVLSNSGKYDFVKDYLYSVAITEHRRWCYHMIMESFRWGEKKDILHRRHPNLMDFQDLLNSEEHREVVFYDLMPLLMRLSM